MGGVDYIDQRLAPYESLRKSVKWYKKFGFHLIDLTVHNSYVLYQYHRIPTKSQLTYKNFLMKLIYERIVLDDQTGPETDRPVLAPKSKQTTTNHFPVKVLKPNGKAKNSVCHQCRKTGNRRGITFQYTICEKRFCIECPNLCFAKYHEEHPKNQDYRLKSTTVVKTRTYYILLPWNNSAPIPKAQLHLIPNHYSRQLVHRMKIPYIQRTLVNLTICTLSRIIYSAKDYSIYRLQLFDLFIFVYRLIQLSIAL
jgi:hypothetical protein